MKREVRNHKASAIHFNTLSLLTFLNFLPIFLCRFFFTGSLDSLSPVLCRNLSGIRVALPQSHSTRAGAGGCLRRSAPLAVGLFRPRGGSTCGRRSWGLRVSGRFWVRPVLPWSPAVRLPCLELTSLLRVLVPGLKLHGPTSLRQLPGAAALPRGTGCFLRSSSCPCLRQSFGPSRRLCQAGQSPVPADRDCLWDTGLSTSSPAQVGSAGPSCRGRR